MPFPFVLPTTSSVLLPDFFDSVTHPSLPLIATTRRSVLKDALKKHKRLPASAQSSNLPSLLDAVTSYLPYLSALQSGTSYRDVGPEKIDVIITRPMESEWRSTLSQALPGREPPRRRLVGLHHEIAFTLATLAYVYTGLARSQLRLLYGSSVLTPDQRTATIAAAIRHQLDAHSVHNYLISLPTVSSAKDAPIDIESATVSALAALALAEANITVVAKDDPHAAAVADDRNENNTDWMFKAPTINKGRVRLLATICLAAAEHAAQAHGLLFPNVGRIDDALLKYTNDLRRTARGKALRFFAIEAESTGKTGEALAWTKAARKELGLFQVEMEDGKRKGLRGLKQSWQERHEDRKVEKGGQWGLDAGRFEEIRIVEMLETKWDKQNNTINVQIVPPYETLLLNLPGGREYPHQIRPFTMPSLDEAAFVRMRAPPEPDELAFRGEEDDSGDDSADPVRSQPVGAFPVSGNEHGRSSTAQSYY